jgi:hypothetical protein
MGAVFSTNKVKIIPANFKGRAAGRRGPVPAPGCGHLISWTLAKKARRRPQSLGRRRDAGKNLICPPASSFSLHSNSHPRPGQKILTFALQLVYA